MFTGRKRVPRGGFTLLEIMLAVAVLAMVSVSIYRFVEGTLSAVSASEASIREEETLTSFASYLRTQVLALAADKDSALTGTPRKFNDTSSDELQWKSAAGSGLFTRHAEGVWDVLLTVKQIPGKNEYELGMRRQEISGKQSAQWLPLLGGVRGFEVRYYDPRAMEWMEKWTETNIRPSLLRVKLWRTMTAEPYEMVLSVPVLSTAAQAGPPPNRAGKPTRRSRRGDPIAPDQRSPRTPRKEEPAPTPYDNP